MKTLKKLLCAALALSLTLALTACGGQDPAASASASGSGEGTVYRIGISQYGEHPSLDNCRTGFLQGLEEAGLKEGVDFTVDYQNANFDDATATQIAGSFSAGGVDMMVGIATPAAVACYAAAEEKDIPVIFTAITDPVGAKLDSGNITGTSDVLPVAAQLELIRALQPEAKSIGIVYSTSEANSLYSLGVYEELAASYDFTIESVGVTAQSEVTQAIDTLIGRGVDCFSNLTDNTGRHPGEDRRGRHSRLRLRDRADEERLRGRRRHRLCEAGHPDRQDGRQGPHRRGHLRRPLL